MNYQIVISFLILAFLNFVGCYSMQYVSKGEFLSTNNDSKIEMHTKDNKIYLFEPFTYQIGIDSIKGTGLMKSDNLYQPFLGKIALEETTEIKRDSYNSLNTWLLIGGITLVVSILLAIVITEAAGKALVSSVIK